MFHSLLTLLCNSLLQCRLIVVLGLVNDNAQLIGPVWTLVQESLW